MLRVVALSLCLVYIGFAFYTFTDPFASTDTKEAIFAALVPVSVSAAAFLNPAILSRDAFARWGERRRLEHEIKMQELRQRAAGAAQAPPS